MYKKVIARVMAASMSAMMLATSMPVMAEELTVPSAEVEETTTEESTAPEATDEVVDHGIIDTEVPVWKGIWFGDNKAKTVTAKPGDWVDVVVDAYDEYSGINYVNVNFSDSNGNYLYVSPFKKTYYDSDKKIDVNFADGKMHCNFDIPGDAKAGTYSISYAWVSDNAGNGQSYSGVEDNYGQKAIPEFARDVKIVVTEGGAASTSSRVPATLKLDKTKVKAGDTITATGTCNPDNDSQYRSISYYFYMKDSDSYIALSAGDSAKSGTYLGISKINEYQAAGDYYFDYASIYDGNKSTQYYVKDSKHKGSNAQVLPDTMPDSSLKITVENPNGVDTTAPVLNDFSFTTDTVNVPGYVGIKYSITENQSGLSNIRVSLEPVDENGNSILGQTISAYVYPNSSVPNDSLLFDQYVPTGTYKLSTLRIDDRAGNIANYFADPSSASSYDKNVQQLPDKYKALKIKVINDGDAGNKTPANVTVSTVSSDLLSKVTSAANGATIHVDASQKMSISKEVLANVKNTGKTLLLNTNYVQYELKGSDITDVSKDWVFDSSVGLTTVKELNIMTGKPYGVASAVFTEGKLPGKTTVRIVLNGQMVKKLDKTTGLFIYAYKNGSLTKVAEGLALTPEWNLTFVTDELIADKYIITDKAAAATSYGENKKITPFADVKDGEWYNDAINFVYSTGIMNGTGNNGFSPSKPCTRYMMVTILYRAYGSPDVSTIAMPFKDVKANEWYTDAVKWAYSCGVTTGLNDTTFGGNKNVTREQLATFLMRFAKYKGYSTGGRNDLSKYPDAAKVSGFAKDAMGWANYYSIINGKTVNGQLTLSPTANATRAEVAQMIMNFYNTFNMY